MASIIGYTRVPFNAQSSKNYTIAPVKQIHPTKTFEQQTNFSKSNDTKLKKPSYHRIFSREKSRDGIMELILDKKQINRTIPDNRIVHQTRRTGKPIRYNVLLSIDLNGEHINDRLSEFNGDSRQDNLQRLMDSLSMMAQEKSIQFRNILDLLKRLQTQKSYRFMSCMDRYSERIMIYFPSTIAVSVEKTQVWLKDTIDMDVNDYKNWSLSAGIKESQKPDSFDGESYFKEIQMFIHHVDLLIESNGLIFHHQNHEPMR